MAEGARREYTAIFSIGGRLLGSFRGAMGAAQARMSRFQAQATFALRGIRRAAQLAAGAVGLIFGAGLFAAGALFRKMFQNAGAEMEEAQDRARRLQAVFMQNQKIRKGGVGLAKEQIGLLSQQTEQMFKQGFLSQDMLDNMVVQLAVAGKSPKQISEALGPMADVLAAAKGVSATEEDATTFAKAHGTAIRTGMTRPLREYGIILTKIQQKGFGDMVKAGRLDDAHNYLLKIYKSFKGVNKETLKAPGAAVRKLGQELDELSEVIGGKLLPAQDAIARAWLQMVNDPQIRGMLLSAVESLARGMTKVAEVIQNKAIPALKAMAADPAMQSLISLAKEFGSALTDAVGEAPKVFHEMWVNTMADMDLFAAAMSHLPGKWGEHWAKVREQIKPILTPPAADLIAGPEGPVEQLTEMQKALQPLERFTTISPLVLPPSAVQPLREMNAEFLKMEEEVKPLSGLALWQRDFAEAAKAAQPYLDDQNMTLEEQEQITKELSDRLHDELVKAVQGVRDAWWDAARAASAALSTMGSLPAVPSFLFPAGGGGGAGGAPTAAQQANVQAAIAAASAGGGSYAGLGAALSTASPTLAKMREKAFADELKDPAIVARLMALTHAEVKNQGPAAQFGVMQTMFNRGLLQNKTLDQIMRTGYYPGVGSIGDVPPERQQEYAAMMKTIMAGADTIKLATGNASKNVGFGWGDPYTGMVDYLRGEKIGVEKGDFERWKTLHKAIQEGDAAASAAKAANATAEAVQRLSMTPPPAPAAPPFLAGVPAYETGGIIRRSMLARIGEGGPEAIIPLTGGRRALGLLDYATRALGVMRPTTSGPTQLTFAPNITIHGGATEAEQRAMDSRLRLLATDFINQFKAAQYQERRLSYEGGYG